ncbi:hypothetical protein ARUE_c33080 [Arthrobacter sp. Rue61a]|nr:hypothetical protein ARUE_c33080 [Arthrobacter sp. Rue61a]
MQSTQTRVKAPTPGPQRGGFRKLVSTATSTGILTAGIVLRVLSLFVLTILLGRSTGANELGALSLLLAGAALMQSISVGGLAGAAVHKLLTSGDNVNSALLALVSSRLVLIFPTFLIGTLLIASTEIIDSPVGIAVFFAGYAIGAFDVGELGKSAKGHFLSMGIARILAVIVVAAPKFIAANQGDLAGVLIWQGCEAALWQLVVLPGSGFKLRLLGSAFRQLKSGFEQVWTLRSLWLGNVLSSLAQRIDIFIVGALIGQSGVGQYSTASRPVEASVILATSMVTVLFNGLVRSSHTPSRYARNCRKSGRIVGLMGLVATLLLAFAGPPLIEWLYGPEFSAAAALMPIYAISTFFVFQRQFLSRLIIIEKAYNVSLVNNLTMLLCSAGLNFALIPYFGVLGAAIAAAVAHPLSLGMSMATTKRGRRLLGLAFGGLVLSKRLVRLTAHRAIDERQ